MGAILQQSFPKNFNFIVILCVFCEVLAQSTVASSFVEDPVSGYSMLNFLFSYVATVPHCFCLKWFNLCTFYVLYICLPIWCQSAHTGYKLQKIEIVLYSLKEDVYFNRCFIWLATESFSVKARMRNIIYIEILLSHTKYGFENLLIKCWEQHFIRHAVACGGE